MNLLQEFFETIEFRIDSGWEHQWHCYGDQAYGLDAWNQSDTDYGATVIFDRRNQTVYELTVSDYGNQRAYRWINPDFATAHHDEAKQRNVDHTTAWDQVRWVDLETTEDFFAKARAIHAGENYDTRVSVPLELDDHELFALMKMAHEQDITLNQLVEKVLWAAIKNVKNDPSRTQS